MSKYGVNGIIIVSARFGFKPSTISSCRFIFDSKQLVHLQAVTSFLPNAQSNEAGQCGKPNQSVNQPFPKSPEMAGDSHPHMFAITTSLPHE